MRKFIWAAAPLAFALSTPAFADDDQPCDDSIVAAVSQRRKQAATGSRISR